MTSLLDAQSQQLNLQVALTATGINDVFTFQNPPQGFTWTGTLSCPSAPTTATFTATVGATQWGEWGGNSVYGPVQAIGAGSQQLKVTASGLTAGQSYVLSWIGSSDPSQVVQPLYPTANSTALTASTVLPPPGLFYGPVIGAGGAGFNATLTPPTGTRTIILQINATGVGLTPPVVQVQGTTSGIYYYDQQPYLVNVSSSNAWTIVLPVVTAIDSSFQVTIGVVAAAVLDVNAFADSNIYDESVFYNGPTSATSLAAAGTLVNGPARLLTLTIDAGAGESGEVLIAGTTVLRVDTSATVNATPTLTFPANTLIPSGTTVTFTVGAGTPIASASWAYP